MVTHLHVFRRHLHVFCETFTCVPWADMHYLQNDIISVDIYKCSVTSLFRCVPWRIECCWFVGKVLEIISRCCATLFAIGCIYRMSHICMCSVICSFICVPWLIECCWPQRHWGRDHRMSCILWDEGCVWERGAIEKEFCMCPRLCVCVCVCVRVCLDTLSMSMSVPASVSVL